METPTIKRVKSKDGDYIWQVTYAGMTKEHHQSWQAMIFYHQAMECYHNDAGNLKALLHAPDPNNHD
jgi:hypothetical protein